MAKTRYIYFGNQYIGEADENNTVTKRYVNEPDTYTNLIGQHEVVSGEDRYHHYDALGSTRSVSDDNEEMTDRFVYDAWGKVLSRTGTSEIHFQYIGEFGYYHDTFSYSYYVLRRLYSPDIIRWLSTDLLSIHAYIYSYAHNSPQLYSDPSGLIPICCVYNLVPRNDTEEWGTLEHVIDCNSSMSIQTCCETKKGLDVFDDRIFNAQFNRFESKRCPNKEAPSSFLIPPCPSAPPTNDARFCEDGTSDEHCGLRCYRSVTYPSWPYPKARTLGGQQCCYEDGALSNDPCCMGSIDLVRSAVNRNKHGKCNFIGPGVIYHWYYDFRPYRKIGVSQYAEIQCCMRSLGIPSGSEGASVSDEDMFRAYNKCLTLAVLIGSKFCNQSDKCASANADCNCSPTPPPSLPDPYEDPYPDLPPGAQ